MLLALSAVDVDEAIDVAIDVAVDVRWREIRALIGCRPLKRWWLAGGGALIGSPKQGEV